MSLFEFLRRVPPDISRYLPKFVYEEQKSLQGILSASSWEHEKQRLILKDIVAQWFVETATWGLSDWERVVEVRPNPGDNYQQRRNRILLKLQGTQTSTVEFLERITKRYISEDCNVKIKEDAPAYTFEIVLTDGRVLYADDLIDAIELYKPAHLGYGITIEITEEMHLYMGLFMADSFTGRIDIAPLPDTAIVPVRFAAFTGLEQGLVRPAIMKRKDMNPLLGAILQALRFERIRPKDFTPLDVEFGEYLFPFTAGGFFSDDAFGRIRARMPTADEIGLYTGAATLTPEYRVRPAMMDGLPGPWQGIGTILQWLRLRRLGCDLSDLPKMAELSYQDFPVGFSEYLGTLAEDTSGSLQSAKALRISAELTAGGLLDIFGGRLGYDSEDLARVKELALFDEDMTLDMFLGGLLSQADSRISAAMGVGKPLETESHIGILNSDISARIGSVMPIPGGDMFYGAILQWARGERLGYDPTDILRMGEPDYQDFPLSLQLSEGVFLGEGGGHIHSAQLASAEDIRQTIGAVIQWNRLDRIGCDYDDIAKMEELGYEDFQIGMTEYLATLTEDETGQIGSAITDRIDGGLLTGGFIGLADSHLSCDMSDVDRMAEPEAYEGDYHTELNMGGVLSLPDDRLGSIDGIKSGSVDSYIGLLTSENTEHLEGATASYSDDVACYPVIEWTLNRIGCDPSDVDRMAEREIPERLTLMEYTAGMVADGSNRIGMACHNSMQLDEMAGGFLDGFMPKRISCDLSDMDRMEDEDVETFILAHQLPYILG